MFCFWLSSQLIVFHWLNKCFWLSPWPLLVFKYLWVALINALNSCFPYDDAGEKRAAQNDGCWRKTKRYKVGFFGVCDAIVSLTILWSRHIYTEVDSHTGSLILKLILWLMNRPVTASLLSALWHTSTKKKGGLCSLLNKKTSSSHWITTALSRALMKTVAIKRSVYVICHFCRLPRWK